MIDLQKEKILITGATGFIGHYLIERFLAEEIHPLICGNRITDETAEKLRRENLKYFHLDLLNYETAAELLNEIKPAIIIHLAGATLHDDPTGKLCYDLNFHATENLLATAAKINIRRFILIGTADEYGNQPPPQNEQMSLQPKSDYAKSKAAANAAALEMFRAGEFPAVVLRPFTAFGGGQPEKMFLMQAIRAAVSEQSFVMTEGRQKRDFIYAADVADAIFRAARYPNVEGKVINIGSGRAVALRSIARLIWEMTGAPPELLEIGKRPLPSGENHDTQANIELAAEILNWSPRTSLESGLQRMIDSVKSTIDRQSQ